MTPSPIEKLATGVPGLDTLSYGGLPRSRATLVTGKSGVGKSILSLQVAASAARHGENVLYIATEETPEDIEVTGNALGFDITALLQAAKFRIHDLAPPPEGVVVSGDFDLCGLVHRIERAVRDQGVRFVVLDSANALFFSVGGELQLRTQFFQFVSGLKRLGVTTLICAEAPGDFGQLTKLGVEDFVCDCVLVLRNVVDGEKRRRSLEIHKYRRSAHYKGQYPCTMSTKGMTIFPLNTVAVPQVHTVDRFSSGVPGLDAMSLGGWLRDSIVLVRGPSGCGKTTLASTYAHAGATRGERVIYYGFEETKPMLLRNMASVNLAFEPLERKGTLRVLCQYPEATSPEDMLIAICDELDTFQPSLLVVDSISSVEHATTATGFRQFMVGIASLLRERGRSALLTQTVGSLDRHALGAPYLSTIADVMVDVDYALTAAGVSRELRVVKMRGSAHDKKPRPFEIGTGGIVVDSGGEMGAQ